MIHVAQGHEEGVGIEVFLKSLLLFPQNDLKLITFHCFIETLKKNLEFLRFKYEIINNDLVINNKKIKLNLLTKNFTTETLLSLESAISSCHREDILITLPSSKDQFIKNNQIHNGHTEYFRYIFKNPNIAMAFLGPLNNLLLLTDHIALKDVPSSITQEKIIQKLTLVLNNIQSIRKIKQVLFSGINPHCGEDGLMGNEDKIIEESIEILSKTFPKIAFKGPIPGDTMQFSTTSKSDLLVYAFHDQGLAPFKTINGLLGINTTFGLPFVRFSPDHGTAFTLYGKDEANYQGMLYVLEEALVLQKKAPQK